MNTPKIDLDTTDFAPIDADMAPPLPTADEPLPEAEPVAAEAPAVQEEAPAAPAPALKSATLRPGRIVVLRTSVKGNVSYSKEIIEAEYETPDGTQKERWETERTVKNPEEQKEAIKLRSRVRTIITGVCTQTTFGLLCPESKVDELAKAIAEATALAKEFNGRSTITKISVACFTGKVADSDVQAAKAINAEVSELMEAMEQGLKNLDAKAVRAAADKARELGSMLTDNASAKLKEAVDVARKAAREMVKAAEIGGAELDLMAIRKITESRTEFLDISTEHVEIEAPVHEGRALDLAPIDGVPTAPAAVAAPAIEIEV